MNSAQLAWNVALLLFAFASLFAGLTRLVIEPLSAVLIILGAMGFLVFPAAGLSGYAVRSTALHGEVDIELHTAEASCLHDKEKVNVRSKAKR
jgi:hypothetical protein